MWPALATLLLLILGLLSVGSLLWARRRNNYWSTTGVPHLPGLPFVGNFWSIVCMRCSFVQLYRCMYNDVRVRDAAAFGMQAFYNPALVLRDPQCIRQVMVTDFASFSERYAHAGDHDPLGQSNVLLARLPLWRLLRARLSPIFSSGKLRQMFGLMADVGRELDERMCAQRMAPGAELEVKELVVRYTTDVIMSCAFGVRTNSLANPNSEFRRKCGRVLSFNSWRKLEFMSLFFMPELMDLFRFRLFGAAMSAFMGATTAHIMGERERAPAPVSRTDLIDTLIEMKRDGFAEDVRIAQASIYFMNGSETSSNTMAFALYELSRRPEVQERLRAEIRQTVAGCVGGRITYEALMEMEYLHMVVSETLRMHPFGAFLNRRCTLAAGQTGYSLRPFVDYDVPDGMCVLIPVAAIHRDPQYYPEPDRFDPERFAPANRAYLVPYTYLPFGVGPRSCLAERFGWLQTKLGLVSFLRHHSVRPAERMGDKMRYSKMAMFLQADGGIYVNLVPDEVIVTGPESLDENNNEIHKCAV